MYLVTDGLMDRLVEMFVTTFRGFPKISMYFYILLLIFNNWMHRLTDGLTDSLEPAWRFEDIFKKQTKQ